MPGIPWTTPAQDTFLQGFVKDFLAEQDAGNLETWFPTVYDGFFERWPEEHPEELVDVVIRKKPVTRTQLQVKKGKIYHWFFNHCKPKASGQLLKLGKKPRVLQYYQAYQRVASETLRPLLKEEYGRYCRELPAGEDRVDEFTWRNQRAAELFEDETEEMKKKVEEYRRANRFQEEQDAHSDDAADDTKGKKAGSKKIAKSLDKLAYTLEVALRNIEIQTGWVASAFVGGWDVRKGKISTFSVHNGSVAVENSKWYQQSGFDAVDSSWVSFVNKVFPNGKRRKTDGHKQKLKDEVHEDGYKPINAGSTMNQPTGEARGAKKKTSTGIQGKNDTKTAGTSDRGSGHDTDKKGKRGAVNLRDRKRDSPSDSDTDSSHDSSEDSSSDSDDMKLDGEGGKGGGDDVDSSSSDEDDDPFHDILLKLEAELVKAEQAVQEDQRQQAAYAAFIKFTKRACKKTKDFDENRRLTIAMNHHYQQRLGIEAVKPGGLRKNVKGKESKKARSHTRPNTSTVDGSSSRKKDKAPSRPEHDHRGSSSIPTQPERRGRSASRLASRSTQPPRSPSPESDRETDTTDLEEVQSVPAKTAIAADRAALATDIPQWMKKPLEIFNSGPAAKLTCCARLVAAWVEFERSQGFPTDSSPKMRLPKSERPEELSIWINHHRNFDRPPQWESKSHFKGFGGGVVTWWKVLQPEWRNSQKSWPPSRDIVDNDSWGSLRRAGPNGIFLVVLLIVWWVNESKGKPTKELVELVEDVEWVVSTMINKTSEGTSNLGKRTKHPTAPKRPTKRRRS